MQSLDVVIVKYFTFRFRTLSVTFASKHVDREDAEAVRSDLGEEILLPYIRDNVDGVQSRNFSVKDAKEEAKDRHKSIKERILKFEGVISGFLALVAGGIFAFLFASYTLIFRREERERQELIDYLAYDNKEDEKIHDEYRKAWNRSLTNTVTLSVLLVLIILRNITPRFYKNSLDIVDRVLSHGDLDEGRGLVRTVFKYSRNSG